MSILLITIGAEACNAINELVPAKPPTSKSKPKQKENTQNSPPPTPNNPKTKQQQNNRSALHNHGSALTDLPHARIQRVGGGGPESPLTNHKFIRFPCNTGPNPLKIAKLPHQHSMWASIGSPAQADNCPLLMVFGASLPLKNTYQSWTSSDKTFWIRA